MWSDFHFENVTQTYMWRIYMGRQGNKRQSRGTSEKASPLFQRSQLVTLKGFLVTRAIFLLLLSRFLVLFGCPHVYCNVSVCGRHVFCYSSTSSISSTHMFLSVVMSHISLWGSVHFSSFFFPTVLRFCGVYFSLKLLILSSASSDLLWNEFFIQLLHF